MAKDAFINYAQLVPSDSRGLYQVEACDKADYFLSDPGIYKVKSVTVNSTLADFGPAFYDEGIVFASEYNVRNKGKIYKRRNAPYLELFYAPRVGESPATLDVPAIFKLKKASEYHEGTVTFANNGETMYYTGNNLKKSKKQKGMKLINLQIFKTGLEDNGKWGVSKPFPYNSDDYSVGHPTLNQKRQYYVFHLRYGRRLWRNRYLYV